MAGILIAFKNYKFYGKNAIDNFITSKWIGFKNFDFFINTPDAFTITRNTILYNISFIVLGVFMAVIFATAINEIKKRTLAKLYQSVLLLPYFLSWIVVGYLVLAFLNSDYGIVNKFLNLIGVQGVSWYSAPNAWPPIIIFLNLWKNIGYRTVIFIAAIASIDVELYEAAKTDGASRWQQILKITIPSLVPLIIILVILDLGRIFNADFGLFYQATSQMGGGFLQPTVGVIDTYVYNALINNGDVGMASAAGLYQAVVGFATLLSANFAIRKINTDYALF